MIRQTDPNTVEYLTSSAAVNYLIGGRSISAWKRTALIADAAYGAQAVVLLCTTPTSACGALTHTQTVHNATPSAVLAADQVSRRCGRIITCID